MGYISADLAVCCADWLIPGALQLLGNLRNQVFAPPTSAATVGEPSHNSIWLGVRRSHDSQGLPTPPPTPRAKEPIIQQDQVASSSTRSSSDSPCAMTPEPFMLPPTPKPDVAHFVEDVNTSMSPVTLEPPPPLPLTVIYPWRPPNAQYSEWTPAPPTPISYATPVPNKVDHLKVGLLLSDVSMILCEMSREHRGNRLYDHYLRLPRVVAKKRREWDGLHWG